MIGPLQFGIEWFMANIHADPISLKDFLLGFFIALSLRRGRVALLLDRALPGDDPTSKEVEADTDADDQ